MAIETVPGDNRVPTNVKHILFEYEIILSYVLLCYDALSLMLPSNGVCVCVCDEWRATAREATSQPKTFMALRRLSINKSLEWILTYFRHYYMH